MRLFLLAAVFLALGCQDKNQKKTAQTETKAQNTEPIQWVSYKATKNPNGKHIVLVSGDEEYRSEEALPQLAKILTRHHGFDCTVLFAQNPEVPGTIDPNYSSNIPGLEQLGRADLMILFTRFRSLPVEQMEHIEKYLMNGQPLLAIRTATHAFNYEDDKHPFAHYGWKYEGEKTDWKLGFGKRILGETWHVHHGSHKHQSTKGIIAPGAETHPIVRGIENGAIWGATDVYGIRMPLGGDAQSIVLGQTVDRAGAYDENDLFYGMRETDSNIPVEPNKAMPPIVWTKSYQLPNGKKGKSVTSTIGAATDMLDQEVRRVLVNASYYLSGLEVPQKAEVGLIGDYHPPQFKFHDDAHWAKEQLKVEDYLE